MSGCLLGIISASAANTALQFDGVNDYVTFGAASSLGVSNFTLECWFKRQGTGTATSTGNGGISAIPLVTKGRAEADGSKVDCNFFLGINSASSALGADFEDYNDGLNHPVSGVRPASSGVWQHAAATYNSASGTWVLYLNGIPDVTNVIAGAGNVRVPRWDSIQHAGLATAMTSAGTADGYFNGCIDEVRIWNYARLAAEITNDFRFQITNATAGLIARWALEDNSGTTCTNSIKNGVNGTMMNGPLWAEGYPFGVAANYPPRVDAVLSPLPGATNVAVPAKLAVAVSDPETNTLAVAFYGRQARTNALGSDFTVVVLPDTQYYSQSYPATYQTQVDWIIANRTNLNIVYVAHVGDIVDDGDTVPSEWLAATNAMYRLESPALTGLPEGIPYGVVPGNHDHTGGITLYNTYFGASRFAGRSYYGGNLGGNNQNHYDIFSAGGLNFIALFADFNSDVSYPPIDTWANGVLATNADRRAIVISHCILTAAGSYDTSRTPSIYSSLKNNINLFLMFCGHNPGEALRSETYQGRTVNICLSDYQGIANGGNGFLRLYTFSPSNDIIHVKTYSPTLLQYDSDANSQFELVYSMSTQLPWQTIGVLTNLPSGTSVSNTWLNLPPATTCEWYATVSDGTQSTKSPVCSFTTTRLGNHPDVVGISVADGGPATVRFSGVAGFAYDVEVSTNLLNWFSLGQVTAATNGLIEFIDAGATNHLCRFYRSR